MLISIISSFIFILLCFIVFRFLPALISLIVNIVFFLGLYLVLQGQDVMDSSRPIILIAAFFYIIYLTYQAFNKETK